MEDILLAKFKETRRDEDDCYYEQEELINREGRLMLNSSTNYAPASKSGWAWDEREITQEDAVKWLRDTSQTTKEHQYLDFSVTAECFAQFNGVPEFGEIAAGLQTQLAMYSWSEDKDGLPIDRCEILYSHGADDYRLYEFEYGDGILHNINNLTANQAAEWLEKRGYFPEHENADFKLSPACDFHFPSLAQELKEELDSRKKPSVEKKSVEVER